MSAAAMLLTLGGGVAAEVLLFAVLRRLARLEAKTAAVVIAMAVLLFYVPWAILTWPGGDVFAIHLAIFLTVAYVLGVVGGARGRGWHWAPALIVGFFVFVVATNVVFLGVAERGISGVFSELLPAPSGGRVADSRFPGTVSHDFQEKEAQYNAYLEQVAAQQARGWQVQKGWERAPRAGAPAVFLVQLRDREGVGLEGASVTGRFLRTSNSEADFDFRMQDVGGGRYRLETRMPQPGLWQLVLRVRRGEHLHEVRATTSVGDPAR
jgi:nitrogen fixation protein FixH